MSEAEGRKGEEGGGPAHIARLCLCTRLRMATRNVTQAYDNALRDTGLRISQFAILASLRYDGEATMTQLATSLGLDRTTLTRNLEPLTRRELVEVRRGKDRRRRVVALTEAGAGAVEAALPAWREAQNQLITVLGPDNRRALVSALDVADGAGV